MKKNPAWLILLFAASSCVTPQAYYQSALHNNTNIYREQPLWQDSSRGATYVTGLLAVTGVNQGLRDDVLAMHGSLHRAQKFSVFQAWYGSNFSLGAYRVRPINPMSEWLSDRNRNLDWALIHANSGHKFTGSFGAAGGINVVTTGLGWGEWRIVGVDAAWSHEFGGYMNFRKSLPDTAVNLSVRAPSTLSLTFRTDLVWKTRRGNIGFQAAFVMDPKSKRGFDTDRRPLLYYSSYIAYTLHFEQQRYNGFCQLNYGFASLGLHIGGGYRLRR